MSPVFKFSLIAPDKPTDKTFAQLVQIVGEHLNPKPSMIKLWNASASTCTCTRQQGESVATFIAA